MRTANNVITVPHPSTPERELVTDLQNVTDLANISVYKILQDMYFLQHNKLRYTQISQKIAHKYCDGNVRVEQPISIKTSTKVLK